MFFAAQAIVPQMRELGYGSIVNMSSVLWMRGIPLLKAYASAKAAIVDFTNTLARALGPHRIRVTRRHARRNACPTLIAPEDAHRVDVDRVPFWFASFLPFFAPGRTVPAQGRVSGRPLNRSPAMALIPSAARWSPLHLRLDQLPQRLLIMVVIGARVEIAGPLPNAGSFVQAGLR